MALYTPEYKPNGKEIAVITTDEGTIRVQLHGEDAAIHLSASFVELAQKGFYDGLKFHRYVPGFVIQGGCPNTREMSAADVAAGKSGPDGMPVPVIPVTPSRASGRPIPTTRTRTARLPWHAAPCPTRQAASSTSASVPSTSSTPTTRSSVTPSRALTSSASFVLAASSRTSRSRTRTSRRTSTKGSLPS